MAYNILEYARSQLEWMTDNLSTVHNGKTAFELPPKIAKHRVGDPGPKVHTPDAALACGLAKELLFDGGNPHAECRGPSRQAPAAELRDQLTPKVVDLMRPQKVELLAKSPSISQRGRREAAPQGEALQSR